MQRKLYPEFVARLRARTEAIVVGDPFDPATQMGPLVSKEHFNKVMHFIARGENNPKPPICVAVTP